METRAAKRRANQVQNQPLKKQRLVLGELPNLTNVIVPQPKRAKKTLSSAKKDVDNAIFVSDIYNYLRSIEREEKRRPMIDYIEKIQREITVTMRGILVDWLVDVAEEYKLLSDTLHLSVSYIDRVLSINPVSKPMLQLLGVSSMLIASKYEEISPPHVEEFCFITDNTYDKAEVVSMEAEVLKALNFELGNPTIKTFLRRFIGIACENKKTLALYECSWYKSVELKECVLVLHDLYLARRGGSFQAIRQKYKQHKFKYVANLPAPPHLPNHLFEE